jgi:hypothetical protein
MNQRSICSFLARKELSALEIYNELAIVLGPIAVAYSTITAYHRQRRVPAMMFEPRLTTMEGAILNALDKQQFRWIRELIKLTCIPILTVQRHLTRSLRLRVKHLQSARCDLTDAHKAHRVTLSNPLLRGLPLIMHQSWQLIITFEESRFSFATNDEQIWLRPKQEPPEGPRHPIEAGKR